MNSPNMTDIYVQVTALLAEEEHAQPTTDLASLEARYQRRQTIAAHLSTLESALYEVRRRIDHLPRLADDEQVRWAQARLSFPNLAFLEVDTDGLHDDADILRVLIVDAGGSPLYNQVFRPRRPLDANTTYLTALTQDMLQDAPRLAEEWERITQALTGRYVLSFNLEFDQNKLCENASRYELSPLTIIGTCLMEASRTYFQRYAYPKLATLCAQIGFPLPDYPNQDAFDRARGQIHLLEAIAHGILSNPVAESADTNMQVNLDDDPFLPEEEM